MNKKTLVLITILVLGGFLISGCMNESIGEKKGARSKCSVEGCQGGQPSCSASCTGSRAQCGCTSSGANCYCGTK